MAARPGRGARRRTGDDIGMAGGNGARIRSVAAASNNHQRRAMASDGVKHQPVAARQPCVAHAEMAERIVHMAINAGIIEHDVWRTGLECLLQPSR